MGRVTVRTTKDDVAGAAFPRPATFANRMVDAASRLLPRGRITPADLERWLDSSIAVASTFADDHEALDRVRDGTTWVITDQEPPDREIWSGEVVFDADRAPAAICYATTLASRLPSTLSELAWQGAMDHFVGHLYPYHRGAESPREYDEAAACRHQHMAAQVRGARDVRYRVIARAIPWLYRAHKRIPVSSYARLRP
jgi:hypothetical protein